MHKVKFGSWPMVHRRLTLKNTRCLQHSNSDGMTVAAYCNKLTYLCTISRHFWCLLTCSTSRISAWYAHLYNFAIWCFYPSSLDVRTIIKLNGKPRIASQNGEMQYLIKQVSPCLALESPGFHFIVSNSRSAFSRLPIQRYNLAPSTYFFESTGFEIALCEWTFPRFKSSWKFFDKGSLIEGLTIVLDDRYVVDRLINTVFGIILLANHFVCWCDLDTLCIFKLRKNTLHDFLLK